MKSMPLFKVTGANGISAKQSGAPGTSSSLTRLIEYVCYYSITVLLIISLEASHRFSVFTTDSKLFMEHIHTENQNLHYKVHCSFPKTPTTKTEIVRLIDQMP